MKLVSKIHAVSRSDLAKLTEAPTGVNDSYRKPESQFRYRGTSGYCHIPPCPVGAALALRQRTYGVTVGGLVMNAEADQ